MASIILCLKLGGSLIAQKGFAIFRTWHENHNNLSDAGCGSGRDSLVFKQRGHQVVAFDYSSEIVSIASQNLGQEVLLLSFTDVAFTEEFDGVWAGSSLLHVPREELVLAMQKLFDSLISGGIFYVSFKYGDQGWTDSNGRHFVNLNEIGLDKLVGLIPGPSVAETWTTNDLRPERANELWLNAILEKTPRSQTT